MSIARERARDIAPAAALASLTALDVATSPGDFGRPVGLSALLLLSLPLLLVARRRRPGLVAVLSAALLLGYVIGVQADPGRQPPLEPFLALLLALFALGAKATTRELTWYAPSAAGLLLVEETAGLMAGRAPGNVIPAVTLWALAFTTGRLLYRRHTEVLAARARADLAEVERDERARVAAVTERTRIARELHDVVAHNLSVIVIQAAAEARSVGGATGETLRTIERTGRETLAELRDLLGLLRTEHDQAALWAPPPSLRQLEDLIRQLRAAGLRIDVHVDGDVAALPAGVDLSAYRITQEALTNVLKHAPGASVRVHLQAMPDRFVVAVTDEGAADHGAHRCAGGGGQGMVGMRERVALYGGTLAAGPRSEGGFAVRAELPLGREQM
jgi:signal transduction histidine kinase